MDPAHKGLIAGLAVAGFSATTSLLVKGIGGRIPPITLNAWRCTVAALIFLPLWWYTTGGFVPDARSLFWIGMSVLFSIVMGDTSFFLAIKKIGMSRATPIAKSYPAFAVLFSWILLGEALSTYKLIGVALAIGGTALMSRRPGGTAALAEDDEERKTARDHTVGVMIALGTALAWAAGAIVLKISLMSASVTTVSLFKTVIAGVMLWAISSRFERFPVREVLFNRTNMLLAGATGITLTGAALLLVYSISMVGAGSASVYSGLAPLFAVPMGVIIFKERMGLKAIIGCVLAVLGVVFVSMG